MTFARMLAAALLGVVAPLGGRAAAQQFNSDNYLSKPAGVATVIVTFGQRNDILMTTFSLLPASNASGNFTKVTQYVPVKIVVDARGAVLPLGTSVEVRIHAREPGSEYPLPWQP